MSSGPQKVIPISEGVIHEGDEEAGELDDGQYQQVTGDDIDGQEAVDNSAALQEERPGPFVLFFRDFVYTIQEMNYACFKDAVKYFMEAASCNISISVEDIILMMTLFVLFASDITVMSTGKESDAWLTTVLAVCFFAFIWEWLTNTWTKSEWISLQPFVVTGYVFSFFLWLDFVSIISLMPDVPFVANGLGIGDISSTVGSGNATYTKAGRIVRLVRLVRLVKLYRITMEKRKQNEEKKEMMQKLKDGLITYEEIAAKRVVQSDRQSKLGVQLSESTTRRVIVMILILLVCIPLLIYNPTNKGLDYNTKMLHRFNIAQDVSYDAKLEVKDLFVDSLKEAYDNRYITSLTVSPTFGDDRIIDYDSFRDTLRAGTKEHIKKKAEVNDIPYLTEMIISHRTLEREYALYDLLNTIFVAIMLIGGAVVFTNDAERLVVAPLDRMMNIVEAVAANPLMNMNASGEATADYETRILETTIAKITGLLRVGFGEAGAGIISSNLSATDSSTIDPLLPGVRIYAMFGFCDIHRFDDVLEKLSKDVLVFVNTIAEIVHSRVHMWAGQCNKNLGNAFVIVWRIGDEFSLQAQIMQARGAKGEQKKFDVAGMDDVMGGGPMSPGPSLGSSSVKASPSLKSRPSSQLSSSALNTNPSGGGGDKKNQSTAIDLRRIAGVDAQADQALIGYLKIIVEINRNKQILKYRSDPRLTENGKEEFKVRMGFGLHAGWAIEGAVGSLQKVDATYLSPHVNMAARLDSSSKQYGVPLLISQDFHDLMTNEGRNSCRKLDVVTVKGSEVPMGIFTYDCLLDQHFKSEDDIKKKRRPSLEVRPGQAERGKPRAGSVTSDDDGEKKPLSVEAGAESSSSPKNGQGTPAPKSMIKAGNRGSAEDLHAAVDSGEIWCSPADPTSDVFENDYDLKTLRRHITPEFQTIFKKGVDLYLGGEWPAAKALLQQASELMKTLNGSPGCIGDGPCLTLIQYIEEHNNEAPKGVWKGFRPLTSK